MAAASPPLIACAGFSTAKVTPATTATASASRPVCLMMLPIRIPILRSVQPRSLQHGIGLEKAKEGKSHVLRATSGREAISDAAPRNKCPLSADLLVPNAVLSHAKR